jgi:hypothetical protein
MPKPPLRTSPRVAPYHPKILILHRLGQVRFAEPSHTLEALKNALLGKRQYERRDERVAMAKRTLRQGGTVYFKNRPETRHDTKQGSRLCDSCLRVPLTGVDRGVARALNRVCSRHRALTCGGGMEVANERVLYDVQVPYYAFLHRCRVRRDFSSLETPTS